MKNWYIVQSYSSFEKKVADTIKDMIKKNALEDKIEQVLIPTHEITVVKKGKRVQREKKYFPGYILVRMEMSNDIYHMIKGINKVSGFLGPTGSPAPITEKEVNKILGQIEDGSLEATVGITYAVGEQVKVCDGPFASFSGLVEEVDEEKSRLKVSVSIFGRPTPVDLEYNQVEKF